MQRGRLVRVALGVGAVLLAVGLLAPSAPAQTEPPAPPDPPAAAVSPIVWQACRSVGLVVGLTAVAGTLGGVPPEVVVQINDLVGAATGPVLGLVFEVCQQIPLPDEPPDCAVDQQVPPLPSLGRPVLLAGLVANQLRALEASLAGSGLPLEGALSQAAEDLLACADGRNPEPEAPAPDPVPESAGDPAPEVALAPIGPGIVPLVPVAQPSIDVGGARPPASDLGGVAGTPVTSSSSDGAGRAVALLVLAGLAALVWLHAGSARRRVR